MRDQFSFQSLTVYQEARKLVLEVYKLSNCFPVVERFALSSQVRRAIISVPSNIAEGSSRYSVKEKIHFLEIAFGSLLETYCQLEIACDLKYISENDLTAIKSKFFKVSYLINALKRSFECPK